MEVRWLVGGGKFTHSPEKLLWSMWSKILWHNHKTTLEDAIYRKKSYVTSLWHYVVITQKWCRPGPKIGKITKRNIENEKKIAWWWLIPLFLYFHELFQRKIVSLKFNTNKASKSVKNENHNFRLPPTTSPNSSSCSHQVQNQKNLSQSKLDSYKSQLLLSY